MNPTVSDSSSSRASGSRSVDEPDRCHEERRGDSALARQAVEERRLAGVRIADERHGRHRALFAPLPQLRTPLAHLIDLALQRRNPVADAASVVSSLVSPGHGCRCAPAAQRRPRPASRGSMYLSCASST
jgi:hypothetical protein